MARAQIRQGKGETDAAIADYDAVLKNDQKNLAALNARAMVLMQTRSYAKAADDFDRVIQLEPKNAQVYYQRGLARERDNKFSDAITDYKNALERDRNMGDARKALARAEAGARHNKQRGVVEEKKPNLTVADAPLPPTPPRKEAATTKPEPKIEVKPEIKPEAKTPNLEVKTPEPTKQAALPKEVAPPPAKPETIALPETAPDRNVDKPQGKTWDRGIHDWKPTPVHSAKHTMPLRDHRDERVAAPKAHRGQARFTDIWNERDGFKR
jgi:hypothetical protein